MTRVVLIGYRGCGKTTVGRELARRLSLEFIDTDELIASAAGCTIAEIFEKEGESGFRLREHLAIADAVSRPGRVISAGGGAVESQQNRDLLGGYGTVIWLTATVDELWERVSGDAASAEQRPNLAGGGRDEVAAILARRTPLYKATAHFEICTSGKSTSKVADEVAARCSGEA